MMLKPMQRRIQRTHMLGNPECWNEFISRHRSGQYPQGNDQLHLHQTQ